MCVQFRDRRIEGNMYAWECKFIFRRDVFHIHEGTPKPGTLRQFRLAIADRL
jgi:hypothetical protein